MDTESSSSEFSLFDEADSPPDHNNENRGAEIKINLRKLKSIRISRLPSLRSFRRREVFQYNDLIADAKSTDSSSCEQSTTTEMSDASSSNVKGMGEYEEKRDAATQASCKF